MSKLLMELPSIGSKSHSDVFNSIFGERTPDFESEIEQLKRDMTFSDYVNRSIAEGRAIRYSEERFNELKAMRSRGIEGE